MESSQKSGQQNQITTKSRTLAVGQSSPEVATTAVKSIPTAGSQAANKTAINKVNCQQVAKTVADKNRTTIRAPTLPHRFRVARQQGAGSSQPAPRVRVPPLISVISLPPPPPGHRTQVSKEKLSKSGTGSPANSNSGTNSSGAAGKKFAGPIANVTNLTNCKRINIDNKKNTAMEPSTSSRQQQQQPQHDMKTRSQNNKNNNNGQKIPVKLNAGDGIEGMGNRNSSSGSDKGGQNEPPLLVVVTKGLHDLGTDYELIDLTTPPGSPLPLVPQRIQNNSVSSASGSKDGQNKVILPPIPQLLEADASKVIYAH